MFMGKEFGRFTSGLSDEDSSFYLWKWFTKKRRHPKLMKRRKKKRRHLRHDFEDEQFFYPDFYTRSVNAAQVHTGPGSHPHRSNSELYNRINTPFIATGERLQVLRNLFPKKRRFKGTSYRLRNKKERLNYDPVQDLYSDMSKLDCS
jgi:hypothetical protein